MTFSDTMNASMSYKYRSITFGGGIRKTYENLITKIDNFMIENDPWNLKFNMFHADNINSIKVFKRIL